MPLISSRIKGMEDVVPSQVNKWHTVEKLYRDTSAAYGFKEIRIPTFEKTELFERSVGETTDVVQKEMFTVMGRESTFTLRPEGTAGAIRAILQNGLLNEALPCKVFYILSCFRHERPQAGRLWEFHQFGAEMAGSPSPAADAEVIDLAGSVIKRAGLKNIGLHINSIGCSHCREKYYAKLRAFFEPDKDKLCPTCLSRLEKNPMRILDCKSEECRSIAKNAPVMVDYLCGECSGHFEELKACLDQMGIEYTVDPKIVRGLDYYTKTVFEFIEPSIGTICGGGRYDGLIEEIGGSPTPALGFGVGLERLIIAMEKQNCGFEEPKNCDVYIGAVDKEARSKAAALIKRLREEGFYAESDVMGRGVKAQMKYANKLGAAFSMIIGSNETESGRAKLKNMSSGEETEISLGEDFTRVFSDIYSADVIAGVNKI
ncbi:MAG: histidine--tRNA ligase [Ruminococcus sp.]|nr:histidine--tRNA ligase [Ruminococcus sp.]